MRRKNVDWGDSCIVKGQGDNKRLFTALFVNPCDFKTKRQTLLLSFLKAKRIETNQFISTEQSDGPLIVMNTKVSLQKAAHPKFHFVGIKSTHNILREKYKMASCEELDNNIFKHSWFESIKRPKCPTVQRMDKNKLMDANNKPSKNLRRGGKEKHKKTLIYYKCFRSMKVFLPSIIDNNRKDITIHILI